MNDIEITKLSWFREESYQDGFRLVRHVDTRSRDRSMEKHPMNLRGVQRQRRKGKMKA